MSSVLEVPATTASLERWLEWLEGIHPTSIDMGLDRVSRVADRLGLRPVDQPLVLVGGTNGKGSTVAMLASIYSAAGYRVGAYTSPHIEDFRERICIQGRMAEPQEVVDALAFVEQGRLPETLTYFEYTTLAAMRVFQQRQCDVYLMEVGLGGRLDATNLWDADCAVVTSIALDHEDYLGSDVSVIATEKAAIGRRGSLLVVGDPEPPESLFRYTAEQGIMVDHVGAQPVDDLPAPSLMGTHQRRNAACAVSVVEALRQRLPVNQDTVHLALKNARIPARFEQLSIHGLSVLLDVAHNPAGAIALTEAWREQFPNVRANMIFACLQDKDLAGIVTALDPIVANWHCLGLDVPRAMPVQALAEAIREHTSNPVTFGDGTLDTCQSAFRQSFDSDQPVLVAGSFHTIAAVRDVLDQLTSH